MGGSHFVLVIMIVGGVLSNFVYIVWGPLKKVRSSPPYRFKWNSPKKDTDSPQYYWKMASVILVYTSCATVLTMQLTKQ